VRLFLIEAIILTLVVLAVAAAVFRSKRAADALRTLRKVGWIYVAVLVIAGIIAGIERNS
jgi:hypothetical protein